MGRGGRWVHEAKDSCRLCSFAENWVLENHRTHFLWDLNKQYVEEGNQPCMLDLKAKAALLSTQAHAFLAIKDGNDL